MAGCIQRLQHTIAFMDETTPTSKAKPAGVMGAEIWGKVDDPPPADPDTDLRFLGVDTRSPYLAEFSGTDGGKPAHYMACHGWSAGSTPEAKRASGARR